ncbi:MAG TPA: hypothetical protein VLH10_08995 [Yinghuangia sp.]|nr:hypothetical protein [Yinghuangia sp.]
MPLRRRPARVLVPLIPLAFLATACGGIAEGWAGHAKTAADSPVGNTGAPNTGISAEALIERASDANRDARGVRSEFKGTTYGVPVSGETVITKSGDSETQVRFQDHAARLLLVGGTTYTHLEQGTYAVLFDLARKAPGYDREEDEPDDSMVEFLKLMEGKFLQSEADPDDKGFPMFNGAFSDAPFTDLAGAGDSEDSSDSDDYEYDEDSGEDEYSDDTELTLGEPTTIDGIEVIPVIATTRYDGTTSIHTMYLPAHGTPLPVRVTSDEDNDGDVDVSLDTRYFGVDGDKTVTAPGDDETVDMDEAFEFFGGGSSDDEYPYGDSPYDDDEGDTATA